MCWSYILIWQIHIHEIETKYCNEENDILPPNYITYSSMPRFGHSLMFTHGTVTFVDALNVHNYVLYSFHYNKSHK